MADVVSVRESLAQPMPDVGWLKAKAGFVSAYLPRVCTEQLSSSIFHRRRSFWIRLRFVVLSGIFSA
jgi:hypothetical protein